MTERPSSADPALLTPTAGNQPHGRLQQAFDRASYLANVTRALSGALQTERATDLVLERLAGTVAKALSTHMGDRAHDDIASLAIQAGLQ